MTREVMSAENLREVCLPKWAGLCIEGERVTPEQASEIIIRTNGTSLSSNSQSLLKEMQEAMGLEGSFWDVDYQSHIHSIKKVSNELQMLNIDLLKNQKILSSNISGPYGWCDWNGEIRVHSINIGRYPTAEDICRELTRIAFAFKYLKMTVKVLDKEYLETSSSENVKVVFSVQNGGVVAYHPESNEEIIPFKDRINEFKKYLYIPVEKREKGIEPSYLKVLVSNLKNKLKQ